METAKSPVEARNTIPLVSNDRGLMLPSGTDRQTPFVVIRLHLLRLTLCNGFSRWIFTWISNRIVHGRGLQGFRFWENMRTPFGQDLGGWGFGVVIYSVWVSGYLGREEERREREEGLTVAPQIFDSVKAYLADGRPY